ncbi:MAG: HEAT repeat domain-containing protein [Flavobacteriales bacterium]|nr:HEAT repeat domain-containing protein [Flavobacteriales bacterium]MCB9449621.1 HEAT repeat domain-containing protein [Flavobacteriales bacterium]
MMMTSRALLLLAPACLIAFLPACKPGHKIAATPDIAAPTVQLEPAIVTPLMYQPSRTRYTDITNTNLDLKFDWQNQWVLGKAEITAKPHFYPEDTLVLDAQNFDLHAVDMVSNGNHTPLKYRYDGKQISIALSKTYTRDETYVVAIDYTAKPNEGESGGSDAITSDKGLYFINPTGEELNKPKQIWSQGETQANSRWFPTYDSPNDKMTQQIRLTVDTQYVTLSNGLLISQKNNGDGTRTDTWKQTLPHSPYLAMVAVGDFAVVHDKWKNIAVDYYLEHAYEPYARDIFGNTPEMLEFYSNVLGIPYAWEKFSQIIVRDFVSGAMENTTAVVHGEFLQRTRREMIDDDNEDVIAHELFHHWFGDLVTCESWSNLPLNESFATYGEYMWMEHKYGREKADEHLNEDLLNYLGEATYKQVDLIRFYYDDREDMFDGHSYQKGGRVLHMLRKYVGDEAFYASLRKYLEDNKFQNAEIHNLRMAFEAVTGEDLNWFFNQWFLDKGHPRLTFHSYYNDTLHQEIVYVEQTQNPDSTRYFKLPMQVDIYQADGQVVRHAITAEKSSEKFVFDLPEKPYVVNVDAEKMLLCDKKDVKDDAEWRYLYINGPLFMDRLEAVEALAENDTPENRALLTEAMKDKQASIARKALNALSKMELDDSLAFRQQLEDMAQHGNSTDLRASAMRNLAKLYPTDNGVKGLMQTALNDSSYEVLSTALTALCNMDSTQCEKYTSPYETVKNENVQLTIAEMYGKYGVKNKNDYFQQIYPFISGYSRYGFYDSYGNYLEKQPDEVVGSGLDIMQQGARDENQWQVRYAALDGLIRLLVRYYHQENYLKQELASATSGGDNNASDVFIKKDLDVTSAQKKRIVDILEGCEKSEPHKLLAAYITRELDAFRAASSGK